MINRRTTMLVEVGGLKLGWGQPIVIQSMTKVLTTNVEKCVKQVKELAAAGCGLVRIAVPTKADSEAFGKIVGKCNIPIIADIHFSAARAIEAIEAGAAKIRLNPGNIKDPEDIVRIIDAAKMHGTVIRVGVNEASIRNVRKKKVDTPMDERVHLMLKEMEYYVKFFEDRRFPFLVLSAKSVNTVRTIEVNRAIAEKFHYPMHLGLTHAGLPEDAKVSSSVAIGTLLAEGIGDTIRVSTAGDPVREVEIAKEILISLGCREREEPELIVCPTCGRCQVDVVRLAKQVKKTLKKIKKPIRVAVMGCIVNGPGEAADADVAVCAAKGKGFIYRGGEQIKTVPEEKLPDALAKEIEKHFK